MEHLRKKVKELKVGESFIFERDELKKIRSLIQKKQGYLIVSAPDNKYKLEKL
jgi:hypothetical protein